MSTNHWLAPHAISAIRICEIVDAARHFPDAGAPADVRTVSAR